MLVFIDESGDAGFKFNKGSSTHFVVALVFFADRAEALKADNHISEIRKQLRLNSEFEFHFHKLRKRFCEHFFREITQFDFRYFAVVIDKTKIDANRFSSPQIFYNFACESVCQRAKNYLLQATIVIDGQKSREFKNKLGNYLKTALMTKIQEFFISKKLKCRIHQRIIYCNLRI